MEKRCCDLRGCPASYYLACDAYKDGKNCFEVEGEVPCCKKDKDCTTCNIYTGLRHGQG
ncbi:hypothetical protein KKG61_02485 [bacterium]|nr:hypothetical protein [bacterium]MBU1598967.1 hypothetical protein [bacterium]